MDQAAIFWPMLLQVGLIYVVYLVVYLRRRKANQRVRSRPRDLHRVEAGVGQSRADLVKLWG